MGRTTASSGDGVAFHLDSEKMKGLQSDRRKLFHQLRVSMAEVLNVALRETRGNHANRRLRSGGALPAVLYGHGEETGCPSVPANESGVAVHHGSRVVGLAGGSIEQAFMRGLQR